MAVENATLGSFMPAQIDLSPAAAPDDDDAQSPARTLLDVIDHNARFNSRHTFCIQAEKPGNDSHSNQQSVALRTVTHAELKQVLLATVRWLQDNHVSIQRSRPVALLLDSDVGHLIHLLSFIALGIPVVVLSVRLSAEAISALLNQTDTAHVFVSSRHQRVCDDALDLLRKDNKKDLPLVHQPASYRFLLAKAVDEQCADWELGHLPGVEHSKERRVFSLHTSGTTGLPKPIWCSHRYLLGYATCHAFDADGAANAINVSTLPLFHGFGMVPFALAMSVGRPVCFPVSPDPPTGRSITALIRAVSASSFTSVPSILEDMHALPHNEGLQCLASLQFVASGGGPLKASVADEMAASGVKILNSFGNTEAGPLSLMFIPGDDYDWHYFRLRMDYDIKLEDVSSPGDDRKRFKMSVRPFGWSNYFLIQDEMIGSPDRPTQDLRPMGRMDDLLVLANGEKVNPKILEAILFEHPSVRAAILFGNDRSEVGVLIEPAEPVAEGEEQEFKGRIWPVVIEANQRMDAHSTIGSQALLVVVTSPGKTVSRSDKGSVLRRQTYDTFAKEIETAYQAVEAAGSSHALPTLDLERLEYSLRSLIVEQYLPQIRLENFDDDADLFELGLDSLQATRLRRNLAYALANARDDVKIGTDFVYQNPSVAAICKRVRGEALVALDRNSLMTELIARYAPVQMSAEQSAEPSTARANRGKVVLMTGTTGNLGPHILAEVVADPEVECIYVLNRIHSKESFVRQQEANQAQCLNVPDSRMAKVKFFQVDTSLPHLGLPQDGYSAICTGVTHIIHNAWPVNFRRGFRSFDKQYRTLQQLLQIASSPFRDPVAPVLQFTFVSSISVVGQTPIVTGQSTVAESEVSSFDCVNFLGYAEAKCVCEKIIARASELQPEKISSAIVRLGQMVGSSKSSSWNPAEHFPALVKASQQARCLPLLKGTHSWLPVDIAAQALREITFLPPATPTAFYHLENPVRQPWSHTIALLAAQLGLSLDAVVPLDKWNTAIANFAATMTDEGLGELQDFFQHDFEHMSCGGIVLDMSNTMQSCPSLSACNTISDAVILGYVEKWRQIGFLA